MPKGVYVRKPLTQEHKKNISKALLGNQYKLGKPNPRREKAYNWKGENASYKIKHLWLTRTYGKPIKCERCEKIGEKIGRKWSIEWANKTGQYLRDKSDWFELCRKCHANLDKWWLKFERNIYGEFKKKSL